MGEDPGRVGRSVERPGVFNGIRHKLQGAF